MSTSGVAPRELLTDDEIDLLRRALLEWGGPAWCSDLLAVGIGFADAQDLVDRCHRFSRELRAGLPFEPADWARILLAVEIVFVSDLAGTGFEWSTTTGRGDEPTIRALRSIQRKLAKTVKPYYGRTPSE
jgi:hypothetical protein